MKGITTEVRRDNMLDPALRAASTTLIWKRAAAGLKASTMASWPAKAAAREEMYSRSAVLTETEVGKSKSFAWSLRLPMVTMKEAATRASTIGRPTLPVACACVISRRFFGVRARDSWTISLLQGQLLSGSLSSWRFGTKADDFFRTLFASRKQRQKHH